MHTLGITDFSLFCAAVFLLNLTPGPDTAFIVGRSLAQGRAAGLVSALGISFGCLFHVLAMVLGLSALLAASATAFTVIKIIGGLYLIWLGLKLIWQREAAPVATPNAPVTGHAAHLSLPAVFGQAALTNLTNPKVILFFLSFFPQFVRHDTPHRALAFVALGAVFIVLSTARNSLTAMAAGALARNAGRSPQFKRRAERVVGAAFIALGLRLALSKS